MRLIQLYVKFERLKALAIAQSTRPLSAEEKLEFDGLSDLEIATVDELLAALHRPTAVRVPFEGKVT